MPSKQIVVIILIITTIPVICYPLFDDEEDEDIPIPNSATLLNFGLNGHHDITLHFSTNICNEYEVYDIISEKCRRIYCRSPYGDMPVRKCTVVEAFNQFTANKEFMLVPERWVLYITFHYSPPLLKVNKKTRKELADLLASYLFISKDRIDVTNLSLNGTDQAIIEVELSGDFESKNTNIVIVAFLKYYANYSAMIKAKNQFFTILHVDYSVDQYSKSFCDDVQDRRLISWNLDFEIIGQNILLNKANGRRYKKGTYLGSVLVNNDNLKLVKFVMLCEKTTGLFCDKIKLPKGSYEFVADGNEVKSKYGVTDRFEVDQDSNVKICEQASFFCVVSQTENTIVGFCLITSSIFLILILITFSMVPGIAKTLPGFNAINLVLTILILQILFLTGSWWKNCRLAGIIIHYFMLLNFSWSSIIGFHIFRTFVFFNSMQYRPNSGLSDRCYSFVLAHLIVLIIIGAALVNEFLSNDFAPHFGPYQGVCWIRSSIGVLFYFAIPVSLSNLFNAIFYLASFIKIKQSLEESFAVSTWNGKSIRSMPVQLTVFSRIAAVLSISWITVLLIPITHQKSLPHQLIKYLFVIINTNQGLLLFIAFAWNKRVGTIWMEWVRRLFRLNHHKSITFIAIIESNTSQVNYNRNP